MNSSSLSGFRLHREQVSGDVVDNAAGCGSGACLTGAAVVARTHAG
jgi:hypothetical protein